MREAMANAPVGDDVYGEDPTVMELERRVAAMCGMEAALFLPSGTMANAVAVRTHTRPGDEIILEREAHIYVYEGGGFAALSGCSVAFVDGDRGRMAPEDVRAAVHPPPRGDDRRRVADDARSRGDDDDRRGARRGERGGRRRGGSRRAPRWG